MAKEYILITGRVSDESPLELVYEGDDADAAQAAMDAAMHLPGFRIYTNPAAKRRANPRHQTVKPAKAAKATPAPAAAEGK